MSACWGRESCSFESPLSSPSLSLSLSLPLSLSPLSPLSLPFSRTRTTQLYVLCGPLLLPSLSTSPDSLSSCNSAAALRVVLSFPLKFDDDVNNVTAADNVTKTSPPPAPRHMMITFFLILRMSPHVLLFGTAKLLTGIFTFEGTESQYASTVRRCFIDYKRQRIFHHFHFTKVAF